MSKNKMQHSQKQAKSANARPTIGYLASHTNDGVGQMIWAGMVEAAEQLDVNLIGFMGHRLQDQEGFLVQANVLYDLAANNHVDGLISWASTLGTYVDAQETIDFHQRFQPLPTVTVGETLTGMPSVLIEGYQGTRAIMAHLIEVHGYRRLAFIRGPENHPYAQERYQAYLDTLTEYDLPLDRTLITPAKDWSQKTGYEMTELLLGERGLRPQVDFDAILSASDRLSLGALEALQAHGIQVPREVSVVGFNDSIEGQAASPPLTSVAVPFKDQGRQALEMVLAMLDGKQVNEEVILPSRLIVRRSCGCLDPAVVQAAWQEKDGDNAVAGTANTLAAALDKHREILVSEMSRTGDNSVTNLSADWAEQLLTAFTTEIDEHASGTFLTALEEVLAQVITAGGDVPAWQNMVSVLRHHALNCLNIEDERRIDVENLSQQARILIGKVVHRSQLYHELQGREFTRKLRRIERALISTFDIANLMDILANGLPNLGISSCFLAQYQNSQTPTEGASLILAYDNKGRIELEAGGRLLADGQLLPEGMLDQNSRHTIQVEALYFETEQLGFVLFETNTPGGTIFETLRGQISSALKGSLLVEQEEKRTRQQQTVAEVSTATSTILDTAILLQKVVDLTKDRFGLYHAHIYLLNETGDTLNLAAGAGEAGRKMVSQGWRIPLVREQSLVAQAARTRQGIIANNVQKAPDWLPNPLLPDTRSELAVPLIVGDRVLGVFDVQANKTDHFTGEDVDIHTMLAAQVAATLQNVNLYAETAQRATELETLSQISRQLSTMLDPDKLIPAVVEQIGTAFNYYYTQIYLFDEARQNLVVASGTGELGRSLVARQHSLPKGRGLVGRAAEHNEIVLVQDVQRHVGVEIVTQTNVEGIYQREADPAVEDEWYARYITEHFGDVKVLVDWLNMISDQTGQSLKLGYVLHVGGVFPNMMRRGIEAAARDLQVEVDLVAPKRESEHLPLFEAMVERRVDGLVVVPDQPTWVEPIKQAMAAGIPVVTANRDLKSSPAPMHVGLDNFQAGMILARELTGLLSREGKDKGKILVSTGVADRIAGVKHGLRHSNYTLIEIEGFLEEASFLKTYWEQAINHHPDAIAVMGLTVSEAPILAEIKRHVGGQWLVGGFDLELETLEAIRDGTVQVTIGQHTYLQAYLPILALVEHIRQGTPLQGWIAEGWLPNALLPETKAEVAVPIASGDQILGVLDVQQNIAGGLQTENTNLLRSVADQVAIALTNARMFEETSRSKEEAEVAKERAEGAKEKAEQAQQRAEQSRVEAENSRAEAEQARMEAEQARVEAEQAKKDIEVANKALEVQIWQTKGQAQLNDKMRGEQDIETLANNVIDQLCEYLPAQTGALYIMEEDSLYRAGHYAYNPNGATRFKLREGLVGQAAAKGKPLFLTDIPYDHLTVRSGFGEAALRHIMVFPFMYEGLVGGVIELGTLTEFGQVQIDFMDAAITNIGITFNTAQVRARVNELLTETQQQAEELQVQGEELRVANEELQSQTESLQVSEAKLKVQQTELETTNTQLEEKAAALEESSTALKEKQNILDQQNRELMVAQTELERKAKELALASKYKSEFLANMSHELRTPLNSLLILARMLADNKGGNLTDEQVESSQIIYSGGTDLLNLINDILDLSKVEAGQMIFNFEAMPLTDLVSTMRMQFDHVAEEKGLDFIVNLAEDLPGRINTDPQRVKQVVKNLLSNAFKFTKEGSVSLSLYRPDSKVDLSRSGLDPSQAVAISVADSGIGMTPEQLQVIFEAFQQADGSTSRQYGGTGLGLSISRELSANLGGQIEAKSEPDKGSTFTLYLPIEKKAGKNQTAKTTEKQQVAAQPEQGALEHPTPPPAPEMPRQPVLVDDRDQLSDDDKILLVIEDDAKFAKIMVDYAHKKTFKCLVAGDGRSGLELVNTYQPHAVILDLNLPDITGWDVLQILKNDPATRHIPVHIMSVDDEDLDAYKKGAMGYLTKPVSQETLDHAFGDIEHFISKDIKTLLLVEDDANSRVSVKKLLDGSDVQISEAETGRQALDLLKSEHFDCMILDLSLPDMTGFEVLNKINDSDQITKCPIIVYTGRDLTPEQNDELMQYADRVIVKGVKSPERLLDETALFLHRVVADMPQEKQQTIKQLYNEDDFLKDKKVLIVDDDMRNSFALSKLLSDRGITVKIARDGEKALDLLAEDDDVDLILMDIMMPVLDGYETTRRIRAQRKFNGLPILALTAKAMKGDREKCLEAGANDYLPKPVDVDRLFSMLRVWLYQ